MRKIGAQIILKALEAPLFHIAYNAGLEGAVIINKGSVASTLLTTESVVANIKEDAPAMPAGGAGMGGMM